MKAFVWFVKQFGVLWWKTWGVMTCLFALIVACGAILSVREPLTFGEATYLAFITAFTVGYGDLTPTTVLGKVIAVVVGYIGLIFVGLTVAIATLALRRTMEHLKEQQDGHR